MAEIHVRTWECAYKGHMPDNYIKSYSIEKREKQWTKILTSVTNKSKVYVAELNGQLVGFCSGGKSRDDDMKDSAEVYSIYVDQTNLHQGVGTKLLESLTTFFQKEGFKKAGLWVLDSNEQAKKFYKSRGWIPDGSEKSETIDGMLVEELRYIINL